MVREETTYYFEILSPADVRPAPSPDPAPDLVRIDAPTPEINRFFYVHVGRKWQWIDRLPWTRGQWLDHLGQPGHETWAAAVEGEPAGYFELQPDDEGGMEMQYFGLLPRFTGRGLGAWMLTCALEKAWASNPRRVWLHTSSFDHPAAIANYKSRGFTLYKEETKSKEFPDEEVRPAGDWGLNPPSL